MEQCRTWDADVTIGCYYGDYSSCDNTIPMSFYLKQFFPSHVFDSFFLIIKVTASYCIASLMF